MAAMGAEPRLRIVRLLLESHPEGMIAGDIAAELERRFGHVDAVQHRRLEHPSRRGALDAYPVSAGGVSRERERLVSRCGRRATKTDTGARGII